MACHVVFRFGIGAHFVTFIAKLNLYCVEAAHASCGGDLLCPLLSNAQELILIHPHELPFDQQGLTVHPYVRDPARTCHYLSNHLAV